MAGAACSSPPTAIPWHWQPLPTGRQASLRGIVALDRESAYVAGTQGCLLRTVDGGRSWQDVAPPATADCDFRDLEALDQQTVLAMVAGQPAKVFRSEDGGASWQVVHEDLRPGAFFDAMARQGNEVVLFGDPIDGRFLLWQSLDAGLSWQDAAALLPLPLPGEAGFAASGSCLVADSKGGFSLVTGGAATRHVAFGGGKTGLVATALPLAIGESAGAFAVAWAGEVGLVVGGDYRVAGRRAGTGASSRDGGRSWQPMDPGGYRSAVLWLDDGLRAIAVGPGGSSVTLDGGHSWRPLGRTGFHALSRGADGSVWACGSDGRVARLSDG